MLICGCMFSGKTDRLIEWLDRAKRLGITAKAFKHARDYRYAVGQLVSHDGLRASAVPVMDAGGIWERAGDARLIMIDEAQFFGSDLVDVCRRLADQGREVVVAGLDRDSWGLPFGPVPALVRMADEVLYIQSVCARCGEVADHTQRTAPIEERDMIGGAESYEPRCGKCFQPPPLELRR